MIAHTHARHKHKRERVQETWCRPHPFWDVSLLTAVYECSKHEKKQQDKLALKMAGAKAGAAIACLAAAFGRAA